MKDIIYKLRKVKFSSTIKSLRIRAIPDKSRRASLLFSEWIYINFYDEIINDTKEIPKLYEIKLTHFHAGNWYNFKIYQ